MTPKILSKMKKTGLRINNWDVIDEIQNNLFLLQNQVVGVKSHRARISNKDKKALYKVTELLEEAGQILGSLAVWDK